MKCCRGDGGGHYVDLMFGIFQWLLSVLLILSSFIVFYVFFWYLSLCFHPVFLYFPSTPVLPSDQPALPPHLCSST